MKISDKIQNQFPEFIESEYPDFINFVRHYYQFLEAGELVLSDISNQFVVGETITGDTSGLSAQVLATDHVNSRIFISTQNKFILSEKIVGQSSGAYGNYVSYRPNPIESISQLLDYRDIDTTVVTFFDNFRDEFMASIPNRLAAGIDKRSIIKNITDLYREKGTEIGHKLFFKMLLEDDAELYYPSEDILDASGGTWSTDTIIRVVKGTIQNTDVLIGTKILQSDKYGNPTINEAYAIIDHLVSFYNGTEEVLEFKVHRDSIKGVFVEGEIVSIIGTDGVTYTFILTSIITSIDITDGGQYYDSGEPISVSGFDYPVVATIETVTSGSITSVSVIDSGLSYIDKESLTFDNSSSNGVGASAKVDGTSGSILMEDLSGTIILEDKSVWYTGSSNDSLLLELYTGAISGVRLIEGGIAYNNPPTISGGSGSGAVFLPITKDVGSITAIRISDAGFNKTAEPVVVAYETLVVKNATAVYIVDEVVTSTSGGSGNLISSDDNTNIIKLTNVTGTFLVGDIITGGSNSAVSEIVFNTTAKFTANLGIIHKNPGYAVDEDGFIGSYAKRIQDSFYYQHYSYVVKTAESINNWRTSVKAAVHPAGFALFGQINIESLINSKLKIPVFSSDAYAGPGTVDGPAILTPDTYTPELFSTFKDIFHHVFGRKLGADGYGVKISNTLGGRDSLRSDVHTYDVSATRSRVINWTKPGLFNVNYDKFGSTLKNLDKYKFLAPPYLPSLTHDSPGIHRLKARRTVALANKDDYIIIRDLSKTNIDHDIPQVQLEWSAINEGVCEALQDYSSITTTHSTELYYADFEPAESNATSTNHGSVTSAVTSTISYLDIVKHYPVTTQIEYEVAPILVNWDYINQSTTGVEDYNSTTIDWRLIHTSELYYSDFEPDEVNATTTDLGDILASEYGDIWEHPDKPNEMGVRHQGYSIEQFKDILISDIEDYPDRRLNITPPSEITTSSI